MRKQCSRSGEFRRAVRLQRLVQDASAVSALATSVSIYRLAARTLDLLPLAVLESKTDSMRAM